MQKMGAFPYKKRERLYARVKTKWFVGAAYRGHLVDRLQKYNSNR